MKKKYWQCPNCGGILQKNESTLSISDKVGGIVGNATCSYCGVSQDSGSVYFGTFDFSESDNFVSNMARDTSHVSFDQSKMRWHYKGKVVSLQSDGPRKWWQFWK